MKRRLLLDDARADVNAHALVNSYLIALYNLFYSGGLPGRSPRMIDVNDKRVLGVWANDIPDCPTEFSDVILIFDADMRDADGEYTQLNKPVTHDGKNYTGVVRVKVNDFKPSTIQSLIIRNLRFGPMSHELIHHLDASRMKAAMKARYSMEGIKNDLKAYANDPMESNAFFHELARELTNIIEVARKEGIEVLGLYDPIESDFSKYLKHLFVDRSKLTTKIYQHLSENRKRRVIARLLALHKQVMALQKEYETFERNNQK